MSNEFCSMLGWVISASILGFAISAVFAGRMKLSRYHFLIPYVFIASIFLYSFIVLNEVDVVDILAENWVWGILAGVLVSIFLVKTVRDQPVSRQTSRAGLVVDITWPGLVYGIIDALFLNVMPVLAVWVGVSQFGWAGTIAGKISVGIVGSNSQYGRSRGEQQGKGETGPGKKSQRVTRAPYGVQVVISRGKIFERSGIETWTTAAKRTVSAIAGKARRETVNWCPIRDPGT
jgi:MFS family permease